MPQRAPLGEVMSERVAGVDVFASQVCPALLCAAFLAVREERLSAPKVVAEVAVVKIQLRVFEGPEVSGRDGLRRSNAEGTKQERTPWC